MAKTKTSIVSFKVVLDGPTVDKVYIVGNTLNLGGWDPKGAVLLKKDSDGTFFINKRFPLNEEIQYKVLADKNFLSVERGLWKEEIENHKVNACESKGVIEVIVHNFND